MLVLGMSESSQASDVEEFLMKINGRLLFAMLGIPINELTRTAQNDDFVKELTNDLMRLGFDRNTARRLAGKLSTKINELALRNRTLIDLEILVCIARIINLIRNAAKSDQELRDLLMKIMEKAKEKQTQEVTKA